MSDDSADCPSTTQSEIHRSVQKSSLRAAKAVHAEMNRGLGHLATIASIAPWLGLFGTVLGIINSFPGIDMERSEVMAMTAGRLSEACVPAAIGLLFGLASLLFYKCLTVTLEGFDSEMEIATLQLLNHLAGFPRSSAR
jgi:biopolymer transport protein ExbB/TolQ